MTPDPLSAPCSCCLAEVGEQCYSTSTDEVRPSPHRMRALAAARNLTLCDCCKGFGWRPEEFETKDV